MHRVSRDDMEPAGRIKTGGRLKLIKLQDDRPRQGGITRSPHPNIHLHAFQSRIGSGALSATSGIPLATAALALVGFLADLARNIGVLHGVPIVDRVRLAFVRRPGTRHRNKAGESGNFQINGNVNFFHEFS